MQSTPFVNNAASASRCSSYWDPVGVKISAFFPEPLDVLLTNWRTSISSFIFKKSSKTSGAIRKKGHTFVSHTKTVNSNHQDIPMTTTVIPSDNSQTHDDTNPRSVIYEQKDMDLLETLLSNGHQFGVDDLTFLLCTAAMDGHLHLVELLLSRGARVDEKDEMGRTPLFHACLGNQESVVELLLSRGANPAIGSDKTETSPLLAACVHDRLTIVDLLLAHGDQVEKMTHNRITPLLAACCCGHQRIVELLVKRGADMHRVGCGGLSPFDSACQQGHHAVVELLLSLDGHIPDPSTRGATSLHLACEYGHLEVVKRLVRHGFDINNNHSSNYRTPLSLACENGNHDVVDYLLALGVPIDQADGPRWTPLMYACKHGHDGVVETLLKKGQGEPLMEENGVFTRTYANLTSFRAVRMDSDTVFRQPTYPLHIACKYGHLNIVKLLARAGASLEEYDEGGRTPLYITCANGQISIIDFLLGKGVPVDTVTRTHLETPLHEACERGNVDVVDALLAHGAAIDKVSLTQGTLLHHACLYGHRVVVDMLLARGAQTDIPDDSGKTPLFGACLHDVHLVSLLVTKGANVNATARNGDMPLYVACRAGHLKIAELLFAHGARVAAQGIVANENPLIEFLRSTSVYTSTKEIQKITMLLFDAGAEELPYNQIPTKYSPEITFIMYNFSGLVLGQMLYLVTTGDRVKLRREPVVASENRLLFPIIEKIMTDRLSWDLQKMILKQMASLKSLTRM